LTDFNHLKISLNTDHKVFQRGPTPYAKHTRLGNAPNGPEYKETDDNQIANAFPFFSKK